MSATIHTLDPKRQEALRLMLGGASCTEAGIAVGVHRSTVFRWGQEPSWQAAMAQEQDQRLEETLSEVRVAGRLAAGLIKKHVQAAMVRAEANGGLLEQADQRLVQWLVERAAPQSVNADSDGRQAAQKALHAAMGGPEEARAHIGREVAAALFGAKVVGA